MKTKPGLLLAVTFMTVGVANAEMKPIACRPSPNSNITAPTVGIFVNEVNGQLKGSMTDNYNYTPTTCEEREDGAIECLGEWPFPHDAHAVARAVLRLLPDGRISAIMKAAPVPHRGATLRFICDSANQ